MFFIAYNPPYAERAYVPAIGEFALTIGLMAVIFPGCTIGDGAILAAGSVLSKHTRVGPGEVWAGVPARRVGRRRRG